jgi:hypothetical protein
VARTGCPQIDQGRDYRILCRSGWSPVQPCGLDILNFTRPVLETALRRRLMADARVDRREGVEVVALSLDATGRRVDGVRIRQRGVRAGEQRGETLAADLAVDASGRGSRAPEWLTAAGFPAPAETSVDAFWGYATRRRRARGSGRVAAGVAPDLHCFLGMCAAAVENPREFPLDTSEKSATLYSVEEIAAPDQPPSTSGSVAFADVWRPVGNLPLSHATHPPTSFSFSLPAAVPRVAPSDAPGSSRQHLASLAH